jgi:hypothetical protein
MICYKSHNSIYDLPPKYAEAGLHTCKFIACELAVDYKHCRVELLNFKSPIKTQTVSMGCRTRSRAHVFL